MPISETKETERVNTGIDQDGAAVQEKTNTIESKANTKTTAVNIVWYIYGLIAVFLALRMALKLFGANASNGLVGLIYSASGVMSAPFDTVFGVKSVEAGSAQSVFEPSILVAIAVYALIAWGIAKLLTINEKRSDT